MISAACYLLTYIFEAWISRMYFSQKFDNQHINKAMLVGFGTSIAIQFGISYIGIPFINLLGFVVCNFLLCLLLFKSGVLQALFNTMILAVTMLITELCVFHLSTLLLGIEANIHTENDIVLWIQAVCFIKMCFPQKTERTVFKGAVHEIVVGRNKDDNNIRIQLIEFSRQIKACFGRHIDIKEQNVDGVMFQISENIVTGTEFYRNPAVNAFRQFSGTQCP